nr:hypothetical protein [uncultured Rhodopila sp.]
MLIITSPGRMLVVGIVCGLFGAALLWNGVLWFNIEAPVGAGLLFVSYLNIRAWLVVMRSITR